MARPQRGIAATIDTSVMNPDKFPQVSPQTISQTVSPVGSLLATPPVTPEPGYIAAKEAGQIITREVLAEFHHVEDADLADTHESSLSQISDSALSTVNAFLDRILHNMLASSRSLSLANLRTAVKDVLKPRLAAEAIGGADEELIECIGEDDEVDLFEDATETMDGAFDLDLVWRRARLRCMVYTRLGDMEEDDEERYIEEQALDGYVGGRRMSRNNGLVSPPVAIWLTAILEFIGENALMVSAQSAYKRCENKYGRGLAGQPLHPSVVTVGDSDLEKIALNPTLGRLWRAWRKPLKSPRPSISRAFSAESLRHRRGDSRSSLSHGHKESSETLSSLREPIQGDDRRPSVGSLRKDSLAEEPEPEEAEQEREQRVVSKSVEPTAVPLPISEHDVDEIEVPGYTRNPDLTGPHEESLEKTKRPTSMDLSGPSDRPETQPSRGPRHMRSQSLPGARRPSVYTILSTSSQDIPVVISDTQTVRSLVDRPVSNVSQAEVFNSLQSPADYQMPEEVNREKRKSTRRDRASFVPPTDRKSGVSEYGGSEGPVLFDRSDYRVDPNEVQTMQASLMSPLVTAATPTDMPSTPVNGHVRTGLRSNRPVSLAIGSSNKLAAPERMVTGEVSPVGEGEYLDSGEVSPLDPSDDEGSVSIAGLKDAKEHMGIDPAGSAGRDSDAVYEDAPEEAAVSPISPPVVPMGTASRTWIEPVAPQSRRDIAPVSAEPARASWSRQEDPTVRRVSDERKREVVTSPQIKSIEKDELPDIPKEEQIKALAAAAHAHNHVKLPQPENIYRSISGDLSGDGIPQAISAATASGVAPTMQLATLRVPPGPDVVPSPEPSPLPVLETATTITRIHRKELSQPVRTRVPETQTQRPAQEAQSQSSETWSQPGTPRQAAVGVTPLQLKPPSPHEPTVAPSTSKLLERRRQLPQVETNSTEKATVQRLNSSPQSPEPAVKQLPARSVPEQVHSPPVAPPVLPIPRETTPPSLKRSASRKASRSGDDAFGSKGNKSRNNSNERSKEFEQLIDSGETIQYTLTPQYIRSYQAAEAPPEPVPMQASNSRDRARGLSITGGFGGTKSRSNTQTGASVPAAAAGVTSTPGFAGIPVRRPAAATPTNIMILGKKSGLAPREAKTDMSSTRDFAEFMRTTGPTGDSDLFSMPTKVVRGPKPVRNTDIQAKPQTAGLPPGMRSPSLESSHGMRPPGTAVSTKSKRNGPKLLARDPQTNDKTTSELIDFIREGPPGESGAHRIPRTVAPFRSTMDSDDMKNGYGSGPGPVSHSAAPSNASYNRYAPSMNSTQESFKTASGLSSTNSHTGLLASARSGNPMGGASVEEEGPMPARKSRKPRDPYAIDFSDEEDEEDEDRLDTPRGGHRREESLVEFLQSQLPPANTSGAGAVSSLGRPIGNGPGMARPKPQARAAVAGARSDTNDLADFFKNSGPPGGVVAGRPAAAMGHGSHTSISSVQKEKKGGIGGMFRRRG